jgi:phosphotriesterase-related protein
MKKTLVIYGFLSFILFTACSKKAAREIMTVKGAVAATELGVTLTHEHILVDFIGADSISEKRWDKVKVAEMILPLLIQLRESGCTTLIDCTPAFLGRDPVLLKSLSGSSGLNIITNTGIYGAAGDKFIPEFVFSCNADQLASMWVDEWNKGIDNTGIRPGFIKTGVDTGSLSDIDSKLIHAAAKAHLLTGLTIASHTGPALPAFEQLDILKKEGVSPEAFIWVHAQAEKDLTSHVKAAKMGTWISFDGLNRDNTEEYVRLIKNMKDNNLLNRVLLSHDSGWYDPSRKNGGQINGYTSLFEQLIPRLKNEGFSEREINQLLTLNPAEAFYIRVRRAD